MLSLIFLISELLSQEILPDISDNKPSYVNKLTHNDLQRGVSQRRTEAMFDCRLRPPHKEHKLSARRSGRGGVQLFISEILMKPSFNRQ